MKERIDSLVEKIFGHCDGNNSCSKTVVLVMMEYFDEPSETIEKISAPFGGGVCNTHISICGAVSGGLMVIGLKEKGDSCAVGKEMLDFVEEKYGSINCDKILGIDFEDQEQVDREKGPKGVSICTPLVKDICLWLAQRYDV